MRRILKVAQREYLETIKTKVFLFSILMTPLLIGGMLYFTGRLAKTRPGPHRPRKIALTDLSNELSSEIKSSFENHNSSHPKRQIHLQRIQAGEGNLGKILEQQKRNVRRGKLDAYLVIDKDVMSGKGKIRFYTHGARPAQLETLSTIERLLYRAVINRRCELRDVSPKLLAELNRGVRTEHVDLGTSAQRERRRTKDEALVSHMVPFFFMFLIFMGIFGMGQHMLSSLIEEKGSRVIEVLLSAVSPFQLMGGKIVGLAGIGLTVISIWGFSAYGAARWKGITITVHPELLLYFAIYYVLGFLLFTSILAGIGAICNTIKEAQSLMIPVSFVAVIPMVSWFFIVRNPQGTLGRVLSFIPPLTPMVMILRLAANPDLFWVEILATIVLLGVSVPVVMWTAAKIFRTGILMYGKRPALREIFRWIGEK